MSQTLVLASGSTTRQALLRNAGVAFEVSVPRIDEESVRLSLRAENASSRDIADTLAEMKARKVSEKKPGSLVLGCDQVLDKEGEVYSKPASPAEARAQLLQLRGGGHKLLSAAVIYENGVPLWRHVGVVRLVMRQFSDAYLDDYIARNWESIRESVGGYKLEEEGIRLFARIDGDHFNVLGLPLMEVLAYLTLRGDLPG